MGADLQGHKEEGNQPPPVLRPHHVRIEFNPYNHDQVQAFWRKFWEEFPKRNDRYRWNYSCPSDNRPNVWILDFNFRDINDAIIFGLKYSR
jgi:hypothetical protein